jgi:hypothetical protein
MTLEKCACCCFSFPSPNALLHVLPVTTYSLLDEDNATYSDDVRRNMEYGTKHEIDGVATMVSRIIPVLFPTLDYYEEGCARMALNENSSFFVVSPTKKAMSCHCKISSRIIFVECNILGWHIMHL